VWGFYERFLFSLYLCNTSILNIKRKDKESERERLIEYIYGTATTEGIIGLSLQARATTCEGSSDYLHWGKKVRVENVRFRMGEAHTAADSLAK
jgi:hypothetical protein